MGGERSIHDIIHTPQLAHRPLHRPLHRRGVAHVGDNVETLCALAQGRNLGGAGVRLGRVAADDGGVGAEGDERADLGGADVALVAFPRGG